MDYEIEILLKKLVPVELPVNLKEVILNRLKREEKKQAKFWLMVYGLTDLIVSAVLFLSSVYLFDLFVRSGFYNYLSLFWSDIGLSLYFGRELVISLAESLPVPGLIIFLSIILFWIPVLTKTSNKIKIILSST